MSTTPPMTQPQNTATDRGNIVGHSIALRTELTSLKMTEDSKPKQR